MYYGTGILGKKKKEIEQDKTEILLWIAGAFTDRQAEDEVG